MFARISPVHHVSSDYADDDEPRDGASTPSATAPILSPDVVGRFRALIEEVTDQLMQGAELDRRACRADAIALLIATSQHVDEPSADGGESPLMYLLLEEQQKAAAASGEAEAACCNFAILRA